MALEQCPAQATPSAGGSGSGRTGFDPYDPEFTEPRIWDVYEQLREDGPAGYSPDRGGFWTITDYAHVRSALRDPRTFSSASGHRIPTDGTQCAIPIDYDGAEHRAYRGVMMRAVTPERVRHLQPFLGRLIGSLVGDFRERGGGDFVAEVALPLPLQVLTEVIGFAESTVVRLRALTEQMWGVITEVDFREAHSGVHELMLVEIEEHRATRPDDFVTSLLDAEVEGRPLDDDERARILVTFAVAGHETTMNAASSLVYLLATHPEQQDRLRADAELAPRLIEEMLRLRSPAQNFARRTTREVDIAGTTVPDGAGVLLSFAAANRDPERFSDPEIFDPDRDTRGHLAFGWGVHQCIGATLARTELRVLLDSLRDHPPFAIDGDVVWSSLEGGNHLGLKRLPLRFG